MMHITIIDLQAGLGWDDGCAHVQTDLAVL